MKPSPSLPDEGHKTWFRWCLKWALRCGLVLLTLILLFYIEEDWRGARALARAKAEIEARGISLDPQAYIPPSVPDAENFGAAPFFKAEKVDGYLTLAIEKDWKKIVAHLPSSKADGAEPDSLPYLGNWYKGETPNPPAIQSQLETFYRKQLPGTNLPPEAKLTDMFGALVPVMAEMRSVNAARPLCRFEMDYNIQPPFNIPLGTTVEQIKVAKILSYEERLALLSGQPDLALEDLKVAWKIDSGLRQEPFLVSGLVAAGVVAIQLGVVNEGLAKHIWNDQQLAVLDNDLGKMDYIAESQTAIRGDTVVFMLPSGNYLKSRRGAFMKGLLMTGTELEHEVMWSDYLWQGAFDLIPSGWCDRFQADCIKFNLLQAVRMTDPAAHRVYPDREASLLLTIESSWATSWWNYFVSGVVRSTFSSVKKFAYEQVQIDEARISCRLERYRLAHGSYPNSLNALVTTDGTELPRDVMNGEPYHYKLNGDDTYMLYSVGWNQKDDDGQLGPRAPYHNSDNLDWIWTNYPDQRMGNRARQTTPS